MHSESKRQVNRRPQSGQLRTAYDTCKIIQRELLLLLNIKAFEVSTKMW